MTLVGCTISRSPILESGNAPVLLKVSKTSASYLAKVKSCGFSSVSSCDNRIWCALMIEVTAAMADDGPKRARHVSAARSMGSNGKFS
ncbi:hypothetical protein Psi01_07250 [Planobispora siamensis]|uniref:Uncharacterized protein n=1 Tax=Planobispora siamensis TaxID=936338 RepID=A0A8J3WI40_9ACTN|nr:hypothetical protein Psi01_07250 [Planobispora siamensis]